MPENLIGSDEWAKRFALLFKKYDGRKHPLEHLNTYQLMVMVILSAQDSDRHINEISPAFFKVYPTLKKLSGASQEDLGKFIGKVRNFANKSKWLITLSETLKDDKNIPMNLKDLVALPGIGRKSANVIISESGGDMEGVIVDLHVLRVTPRIGIAKGTNPEKIEKQLMEKFPQKNWRSLGMGLTFLGREICRPTNPKCGECPVNKYCEYHIQNG